MESRQRLNTGCCKAPKIEEKQTIKSTSRLIRLTCKFYFLLSDKGNPTRSVDHRIIKNSLKFTNHLNLNAKGAWLPVKLLLKTS
jgi:hypothetical protein